MQSAYPIIEQLDLAAEQLAKTTPAYSRFALLLADNAVELLLHQLAEHVLLSDANPLYLGEPKYPAEERRSVLGQHFDVKVKFAHRTGYVDEDQRDFILFAHRYRNELYHVGIRHEPILHALAWEYHRLACDLLPLIQDMSWSSNVTPSTAVVRHVGPEKRASRRRDHLERAVRSLHALRVPLAPPFCQQLAAYAEDRVREIDSSLDFLISNNPNDLNESQMLFLVQFNAYLQDHGPDVGLVPGMGANEWWATRREIEAKWKPPRPTRPTPGWRRRVATMRGSKSPALCVKRFDALITSMEDFETAVHKDAAGLDEMIQLQIDDARGK